VKNEIMEMTARSAVEAKLADYVASIGEMESGESAPTSGKEELVH
jgi:hypothetical protein